MISKKDIDDLKDYLASEGIPVEVRKRIWFFIDKVSDLIEVNKSLVAGMKGAQKSTNLCLEKTYQAVIKYTCLKEQYAEYADISCDAIEEWAVAEANKQLLILSGKEFSTFESDLLH